MEYTLKITITPTDQDDTFYARIFITADEGTQHVGTEQIWERKLWALQPSETADPRMWALMLTREVMSRLEPDAWERHIGGSAKTMLNLFEHKQHLIN